MAEWTLKEKEILGLEPGSIVQLFNCQQQMFRRTEVDVCSLTSYFRKLYHELTECRGSVEDVCRCLIRHGPSFHCYVPFVRNLTQGEKVLSQYGGTFFEDLQREEGDDMSLLQHYTR